MQDPNTSTPIESPFKKIITYVLGIFYIGSDTDQEGTVESIKRSVEFKGIAVWTLVFAVVIASVGLNINSAAVIIGAMLISPLMGPIMGAGLALGTYDFDLLKKSLKNLAVMTGISIVTSTLYFMISPLSDAQSELLARTTPTIYDVLIAIVGGATGILAGSRKDKLSNAIPGVAIATALMPPLCTAGYGIANHSFQYFAGAFYLYGINTVFIGLSTFFFVKYLRFQRKHHVDEKLEKKLNWYITTFAILFILPSIFLAYNIVAESKFQRNAKLYVSKSFNFKKSRVLSANNIRTYGKKVIEVTMVGESISDEVVAHLETLLPNYQLEGVELRIIQSSSGDSGGRENYVANALNSTMIRSQDEKIKTLEGEVGSLKSKDRVVKAAAREVNILFPQVDSISFGDLLVQNTQDLSSSKEITLLVKWKTPPSKVDRKRFELFLKSRLDAESLVILDVE